MRIILYLLLLIISLPVTAQRHSYVSMKTDHGTIIVRLANETPIHRDNFIRLVRDKYFDTTLFHRVVPNFVIQGGDPDSLFTTPADTNILKQQRIMPEFHPSLFHKYGAFGMGRDDNPLKASFFTQFYIVIGRPFTDSRMDTLEKVRMKGQKISPERREVYRTIGGTPYLDGDYTIFGEVVKGMDVVKSIVNVKAVKELPVQPVRMKVRMLKNKAAKKLEEK